jgi:MFS family permease
VKFYGWKLLAVLWLILFTNFGFPLYGASVINAYMAAGLHFDRSTLGTAFAIFQLMTGVPGPLVALSINKKGVRFTLIAGCLLELAGALMMARFVHTSLQVCIVFGVLVGLGAMTGGPLAAQSALGRWFERRKALAISAVLTGGAIGGLVAPPLLNRLIMLSGGNWRAAWWLVAACNVFAMLLAFFFVKEQPSDLGQVPDGRIADDVSISTLTPAKPKREVYHSREQWRPGEVWRSATFWLTLVACFGFSPGYSAFLAHGVVHLKDLGYTPAEAAFSLSVMLAASLLGTLMVAWLGDRIEPRFIWAGASLAFGAGLLLSLHATGPAGLWIYAILMGAGFGACFACLMTLPGNYFGHQAYATVMGVLMAAGTISGAVGAFGAGYVYDHFGSYNRAFYTVALACLISFLILIVLRPPVRKRTRPAAIAVGA